VGGGRKLKMKNRRNKFSLKRPGGLGKSKIAAKDRRFVEEHSGWERIGKKKLAGE